MIKLFRTILLASTALVSSGFFFQPRVPFHHASSGIIMPAANNLSTNWQNAGLAAIGGIPVRNTVCTTVKPSGVTPPAGNDDANNINNAITGSCSAGQVLMLGSGVFQLDTGESGFSGEVIQITKGITLRGTGNCNGTGYPYCQTIINNYSGVWSTYIQVPNPGGGTTPQCTLTTGIPPNGLGGGTFSACPNGTNPMILVSPFGCCGNEGWGLTASSTGASQCQANNVNPVTNNCGTTLTADAAQGNTTIHVTGTANFVVGGWVLIDESPQVGNVANPIVGQAALSATPDFLSSSPSPVTMRFEGGDETCTYSFCDNRLGAELHVVTSIGSGTLTFDDPLTMAMRVSGSHTARAYWPSLYNVIGNVPFLQQAGIENLTITRATDSPIVIEYCAYCWVKNVETAYWDTGINFNYAARSEITGSYLHDCADCQNDGSEYPIGINTSSTEILVDNNIVWRGGKGMVGRGANTAVVAYNYVDDTFYEFSGIGNWFLDMDVNGSHYAGTHHFLFEGNWGDNCDGDETHGSAAYHVFFRNECTGLRTPFTDPSVPTAVNDFTNVCYTASGTAAVHQDCAPLRAAGPMAYNYWYAFVGNVLGMSGTTTAANGWVYFANNNEPSKQIWMSGWTGSEWATKNDPNLTGTGAWIFRNGNYDYVTPGIADNAAGYSQVFPNSLYLNSAPAFFSSGTGCTYTWPWVNSQGSPLIQTNSCGGAGLPALARFKAGTPFVQP